MTGLSTQLLKKEKQKGQPLKKTFLFDQSKGHIQMEIIIFLTIEKYASKLFKKVLILFQNKSKNSSKTREETP